MKLITEVSLPAYPFQMDHHSSSLFMGSCFTDNIGRLLERSLFPVTINPFGTIFNPRSVLNGLEALLNKKAYSLEDLDQFNGQWFSFDHYTGFSSPDSDECLAEINSHFKEAKETLRTGKLLVITWGTSWVFRLKESGNVVNNCHKIPSEKFDRFRLGSEEIVDAYASVLPEIFRYNPDLKVLLTVSPVRHWKDGAHGNQLSKASLLLASDQLEKQFPGKVFYFPSYEIVMDELRDYRFFANDMLHLNDVGVEYIRKRFEKAIISKESQQIIRDVEPLLKMREHRSTIASGEAFEAMHRTRDDKLNKLKSKYPFIEF